MGFYLQFEVSLLQQDTRRKKKTKKSGEQFERHTPTRVEMQNTCQGSGKALSDLFLKLFLASCEERSINIEAKKNK